ncbi:gamma-glutamyl phosphate reductase [Clostridium sp. CAG:632]|jgi:glutamate-5-semialdehyde dehydrogenase|nr:gamma-glutamyl phosphate reductase [Clostridium sp. CAG:632]
MQSTNKKMTRNTIKEMRLALKKEEVMECSKACVSKVLQFPELIEAKTVCVYMPTGNEIDTTEIIRYCKENGKRLAAPRVNGDTMEFYYFTDETDMEQGAYDIWEPTGTEAVEDEESLVIMPGVAFDLSCNRIGYGKGYYDRYLSAHPHMKKVALAYDFQIVGRIKREVHDVRPDVVVTESRVIMKPKEFNLEEVCRNAKQAARTLNLLDTAKKNACLLKVSKALEEQQELILKANAKDIANARKNGMAEALIDRLSLNEQRMHGIIEGVIQVVSLTDPVGTVISRFDRPNGLHIEQVRVPFGVIGIIYESRPNVTVDAFSLCFKTGNAVVLRGGSDAIYTNQALVTVIRKALKSMNVDENAICLIEDTSREVAARFMKMKQYIDVLIPRGGAGLIQTVVEQSTIPVIETGTGNCHIYIDRYADVQKAVPIVHNAKLQRLGVCNACESLVIHEKIADKVIPLLVEDLQKEGCEIRGDERVQAISAKVKAATEEDYGREYLAKIISVKIVKSVYEAIDHINRYSTGHSEAIITENEEAAKAFTEGIDSACVYVNASTRFTDGFEFGFGAEIGISTQKLHARGPMGLLALTSSKYIIHGNGQIRS